MKATRFGVLLAVAGASLLGGQSATERKATATVCMKPDQQMLMGVRPLASAIFARIGVGIDWREPNSCPAGVGVIRVEWSYDSRRYPHAEALAFAKPYAGTIVVFVDRVQEMDRSGVRFVMAHVLVHEITHIIEGIDRHSASGVMKAHWNADDYFAMRRKPLMFAQEDIDLIHAGLKTRRARPVAVVTGAPVAGQ